MRDSPRRSSTASTPGAVLAYDIETIAPATDDGSFPPWPLHRPIAIGHDVLAQAAEVQRRDEKRRKQEMAAAIAAHNAERTARDAETAAADRRRAMSDLLITIEEERHYVAGTGRNRTVDAQVLARFEVVPGELADVRVQRELAAIADRQAAELRRIDVHVRRFPSQLRKERGCWLLDEAAPDDMRELVAGWGNDPTVQGMLERLAAAPSPPQAGSSWRLAREARERAMHEADTTEHRDHPGIHQPRLRIARPDMADGPSRPKVPGRPIERSTRSRGD